MANPAQPPVPPTPAAEAHHDEFTGVYGFFRRHQKKLLYTAGLFTLLTFSVTGPMMSAVGEFFAKEREMPSIEVLGKRVKLEPADFEFGDILARNLENPMGTQSLPPVLPALGTGEAGRTELPDNLAILRRAAIAEGIDVSMVEVDRAIENLREQSKLESVSQLARQRGFGSLAQYREVVREAMRIGTYVRLQTLALDCSDARVLEQVLRDREKITLRAATLDEKAIEAQMKAAGPIGDDDLRKWLEGKDEATKERLQVYDSNHLELRFAALLLGPDDFDASQWQEEVLKDFVVPDDSLKAYYNQEKDLRYKVEGTSDHKPFEDVKAEVLRVVQAERVMNHVLQKLGEKQLEAMKAPTEASQKADADLAAAQTAVKELETKIAEKPDDAELAEQMRAAKATVTEREAAVAAARQAVDDARAAWDMTPAFAEIVKDKKGFVQKPTTGKRNVESLKDLDAGDLGFGQWPTSGQAAFLSKKGMLAAFPGRTGKAVILYQVTDVDVRPMKAWDKLRPVLEGAYYTEQATAQADAKKKVMEEALLRLAKTKMPEKVAEIEGKRAAKVEERLAEWERKTNDGIAEAERTLQPLAAGTQAQMAWQRKLDALRAELGKKDARRAEFDAAVAKELEAEIAEEAKKYHHQVLAEAAAEAGFTVAEIGPHVRDLQNRPRFDKAFDPTVVFLFRDHSELKLDETTGLVRDDANRRWHVAVCTKVEPLTAADVTRREFEAMRTYGGIYSFATQQTYVGYGQAFTREALEKRYAFHRPVGEQQVQ
jgi:hypothetical protein